MSVTTERPASFTETETRSDEMNETIKTWVNDLVDLVDDAATSEEFQAWLDVQSHFHDYSYRNTLLIKQQCPHATHAAGYNTWANEFDRYVQEGESGIWIWAPIITKQCPACGNSPSYHENSPCEYDETAPEKWSKGLVGFKPTAVFDISQTEGEPLPDLETEAYGEAGELVPALLESAECLDVDAQIVSSDTVGQNYVKIGRSAAAVAGGDGREFATDFVLTSARQYQIALARRCQFGNYSSRFLRDFFQSL